jgi:N-acetylmuramoyl-L-alanine amidase
VLQTGKEGDIVHLTGKCSWFGGPQDTGVAPDEGLAFIYSVSDAPDLFLPQQPPGTTGLARRLDPDEYYVACRWDYDQYPKPSLLKHLARVTATKTGKTFLAAPGDWGPNENTGRIADLSPGLMEALGITTDDEVTVEYPAEGEQPMAHKSIVISAGHSAKCIGAVGIIDEYTENVRVVNAVFEKLQARGVTVKKFIDTTSTTSSENLNKIVNYHNAQQRDLDVSIHFNANAETSKPVASKPVGTECLYLTQQVLADDMAEAISLSGLIDRGPKKRTDLFFLNNTTMPAILTEVCFVDSAADVAIYEAKFDAICEAIADVLGGEQTQPKPPRPDEQVEIDINMPVGVKLTLTVNGEAVIGRR